MLFRSRCLRHPLAHDHRRHLVELHAAVRFGDVDAEEAELTTAPHELPREIPVLLLEAIEHGQDLLVDEIRHGPGDEPVFVGHPLGCTGAKLTTTLLYEMKRRSARYGMVTMCVGGGMGAAGIFERIS